MIQDLLLFSNQVKKVHSTINDGGCGVFAYHMAKRLEQYMPIKLRVYANIKQEDMDTIRLKIIETKGKVGNIYCWNRHDFYFGHIVIEIEFNGQVYHYDANGLHLITNNFHPEYNYLSSGYLHLSELEELIKVPHYWNDEFDRKEIPILKRRIKRFFSAFIELGRPYYTPFLKPD